MKKILTLSVIVFLIIGSLFFLFRTKHTNSISEKLNQIPREDREALDWFFCYLNRDFSYVLFGNKPMADCCFLDTKSSDTSNQEMIDSLIYFFDLVHLDNLRLKKGWETWEKYKELFPSPNFVLVSKRSPFTSQIDWIQITMIHKENFLQKIRDHIEDFQTVLGNRVTPEEILQRCQSENIFHDTLKYHDGLLGTLFGYGRNNAWLFQKRYATVREERYFSLKKPSIEISREEYKMMDEKFTAVTEDGVLDFNPLLMTLPGFRADLNDPETIKLKKEYLKQYKNIVSKYKNGNFLEITLKKFTALK